jgi:hypothetical protein
MRWTPHEEKRALEEHASGKSYAEIALLLGRTEGSIEAKLNDFYRRQQGIRPVKVPNQFCWHKQAEDELIKLFLEGHSNRKIAELMNGPTQGSVSSKIKVLQAFGRLPRKASSTYQPTTRATRVERPLPARHVCDEIDKLERHSCRFPVGDLSSPDFHFCKKPRCDVLSSYCAEHHAICWEVKLVRRRRSA